MSKDQYEGMGDYAGMHHATVERMEQDAILQQGIPIGDEYCWMHNEIIGGGGWYCVECFKLGCNDIEDAHTRELLLDFHEKMTREVREAEAFFDSLSEAQ